MFESNGKACRLKLCGGRRLTRSRIGFIAWLDGTFHYAILRRE